MIRLCHGRWLFLGLVLIFVSHDQNALFADDCTTFGFGSERSFGFRVDCDETEIAVAKRLLLRPDVTIETLEANFVNKGACFCFSQHLWFILLVLLFIWVLQTIYTVDVSIDGLSNFDLVACCLECGLGSSYSRQLERVLVAGLLLLLLFLKTRATMTT